MIQSDLVSNSQLIGRYSKLPIWFFEGKFGIHIYHIPKQPLPFSSYKGFIQK